MERVDTTGIGFAKRLVAEYLRAELPGYLDELRVAWNRPETDLPLPKRIEHQEPQALDVYPLIAVVGVRTPARRRLEHDGGGEVRYQTTYGLRVFIWVRDQGWSNTVDTRDDLTAAVSSLLLDRQTLDLADVRIDETTIAEEYSDVTVVRGDRFVAGSYVEFDLLREEALRRDRLGTVAAVELQPEVLPHPALM